MHAHLVMAEAATRHPDGTVSMLRAGITHLWAEKPPWTLNGALVVHLGTDPPDKGQHEFQLECMDQDGKSVLPAVKGQFMAPQGRSTTNLVIGLSMRFEQPGPHTFYFTVDKVQRGEWTLQCAVPPQREGAG
ncbi:MAG TPA: hypothetical protein VML54_04595 [Candidatus Limnocylindrales bacterium]|nr:hypothetical protein [Candidatus Limnocylindrales bacterium]